MNRETLKKIGIAAYGRQWQSNMADDLGVYRRTFQRWVSGESKIPELLVADLQILLRKRLAAIQEAQALVDEKFYLHTETGKIKTQPAPGAIQVHKNPGGEWVLEEKSKKIKKNS